MENSTRNKQSHDAKVLLGLSIASLVVSILPISLIENYVAVGLLIFNIFCLSMTVVMMRVAQKTYGSVAGKHIASLVLNIVAIISVLFYLFLSLVVAPTLYDASMSAACRLQTTCQPE